MAVIGGWSGSTLQTTVYLYDPATNSWKTIQNTGLTHEAYMTTAVSLEDVELPDCDEPKQSDDWVMAVGGNIGSGRTPTTEIISLDPANNPVPQCHKKKAPIPYPTGLWVPSVGYVKDGQFQSN